jgi:hypothetical protein
LWSNASSTLKESSPSYCSKAFEMENSISAGPGATPGDVARIIISFAQNGLLDRRHTPISYREGLRKTLSFVMDSIRP